MFLMNVDEITRLAIAWGPTVVFLLILLGGTIWGFIRGFRKSTILAIHALIALAICLTGYLLIVTNPDVDSLVVQYINQAMGDGWIQNQMGVSASCAGLKDCLIEFIPKNMDYGEGLLLVLRDNGQYLLSLVNMAYHIIFALVFGIIYLVLILIGYLFIYHIFYPERRYKRKKMKREAKLLDKGNGVAKPYKKRRLLGGFIGATRGLVAGLVCMSFLGALFFVIAGGTGENSETEDNGYDFGDQNINLAHNIYQNVSHYGETGIFKLLNSLKDEDQIPYYLFASELVFQGGSKSAVDENGNNTNIALTRELTAYTSFARKTFDLILANDTNGLVRRIVKNEIPQDDILVELSSIMGKKEFQNDFNKLIDDFNANTYFINLGVSLIDSVAKNLGKFENLGLSEDVLEITNILFNSEHKSEYIPEDKNTTSTAVIKVSDLVTKDDTKALIKTGISVLGLDTKEKDDVQRIIAYTEKVVPSLQNFSILHDDSKAVNFNNLLERVFTYSVNRFIPKEENEEMVNPTALVKLVSEETGTGINWIGEIDKVFDLSLGALKIAGNVYEPGIDLEKDYLDLVAKVFDKEEENYEETHGAFTTIKDSLSNSSLLSLVMTETGMYKKLEEEIIKIAPDAYIKEDIDFINRTDEEGNVIPGEVSNLLTAVETALSNKDTFTVIKEVMDGGMDTGDMSKTLDLASRLSNIITVGDKGSRVIDSLLGSDIFSSVLSGVVVSMKEIDKENNIILYLPDRVLETVNGEPVNLIKQDEILTVIESLPGLIDIVKPYMDKDNPETFEKITPLINSLADSASLDKLLTSDIVEGTLVNAISGALKDESLKDFIVMPAGYVDSENNAVVDEWLEHNEITSMVKGVAKSGLDFDKLMDKDVKLQNELLAQIEVLAEKEEQAPEGEKPLSILLSSQLLHYSISGMLTNPNLIEGFAFYVPDGSFVEGSNKQLIKVSEITSIVTSVPSALEAVGPYLDDTNPETYNKLTPLINSLAEEGRMEEILGNDIIHGTMANTITKLLSEPAMADMIVIPDDLKVVEEINGNTVVTANFPKWKETKEIEHIVKGVSLSGLDLDVITKEGGNKQDDMLEQIKALSTKEKTEPEDKKPVHNLVKSQILHYTLSGLLITEEGEESLIQGVDLYVPEQSLVPENKMLIKENEISTVVRYINDLLGAIDPFITEGGENEGKVGVLISSLVKDDLIDNLVNGSFIVHGTLCNTFGNVLTKDNMKDIIVMPDDYIDAKGNVNVDLWMDDKEILNVIHGISDSQLNLDAMMDPSADKQEVMTEELTKLANNQKDENVTNKPVDALLKSQIMRYTLSGFIIPQEGKESLIKGVDLYVPKDSLEVGNPKLIKDDEIKTVIINIPDLLNAVNPYIDENDPNYDGSITKLVRRLDALIDNLLVSGIVHGTLVNTIGDVLTGDGVKDIIVMPDNYLRDETINGVVVKKPNVEAWMDDKEISNVVHGIAKSELDLDVLMQDGANKQEAMIGQIKGLSKRQKEAGGGENAPVNLLLKSNIMHYTLSGVIMPAEGKDGFIEGINIIVPEDVKDNKNLVSEGEIINVVVALPSLLNPIDAFQKDNSIDNLVLNLTSKDNELNVIPTEEVYKSKILKYTLADKLTDELSNEQMKSYITLPTGYVEMKDGVATKNLDRWFANGNEIDNLLQALIESGIKLDGAVNGEGFDTKAQINTLASKPIETLNNKIFGSAVIHYTVSGLLAKPDLGVEIIVPKCSKDTNDDKLVLKNELSMLIKSVPNILDNTDNPTKLVEIIVDDSETKGKDAMLQQPILLTTIVNYLNTNVFNTMDMIVVPGKLEADAKVDVLKEYNKNTNLWADEVSSLMSALKLMVFPAESNPKFNITDSNYVMKNLSDNIKLLNKPAVEGEAVTRLDKVYNSHIMRATLAKNMDDAVIKAKICDEAAYNSIKASDLDYKYIPQEEMKVLVNSSIELKLDLLDIDTSGLINELNTLNDQSLTNTTVGVTKIQVIYSSQICKLILTKQLDEQLAPLVTDVNALDAKEAFNGTLYNVYLSKEIEAVIESLGKNYLDIKFAVGTVPNLDFINLNNLDEIIEKSNLIKGILTKALFDVNAGGEKIIIPKSSLVNDSYINNTEAVSMIKTLATHQDALFITKIINGVKKANLKTFSANGLTIPVLKSLLDTDILHATAIFQINSLSLDGIIIPDEYKTAAKVEEIKKFESSNIWLKHEEIKNLVNALGVFIAEPETTPLTNITSDSILGAINNLGNDSTTHPGKKNLDVAYMSNIIQASMAPQLDSVLKDTVINPTIRNSVKELIPDTNTVRYSQAEVSNMINALNSLEITDILNLDPNVVRQKLINKADDYNKLNTCINGLHGSRIVWSILSQQIDPVLATLELSQDVLDYIKDDLTINTKVFKQIKAEEVINLVYGIKQLCPTIGDISDFKVSDVADSIFNLDDAKLQNLERSTIIWYMLAKQLDVVLDGMVSPVVIAKSKEKIPGTNIEVYKRAEILGLIQAVDALGMSNLDGFSIMAVKPENVSNAYSKSNIIKDIISNKLDEAIVSSSGALKTHASVYVEYELDSSVKFYKDTEIKALLTFITSAGGDLGSFNIATLSLTEESIGYAKDSIIINATITAQIKKSFIMIKSAYQEVGTLLTTNELGSLLNALVSFGLNLGNASNVNGISPATFKTNLPKISKSILMRAMLSDLIAKASAGLFYVSNDPLIAQEVEVVENKINKMIVLTEAELNNFLNALIALSGDNPSGFEFTINYETLLTKDASFVYTVCKSSIAMNVLSNVIADEVYTTARLPKDTIQIINESGATEDYKLVEAGNIPAGPIMVPGYKLHEEVVSPAYNLKTGVLDNNFKAKTAKDIVAFMKVIEIIASM